MSPTLVLNIIELFSTLTLLLKTMLYFFLLSFHMCRLFSGRNPPVRKNPGNLNMSLSQSMWGNLNGSTAASLGPYHSSWTAGTSNQQTFGGGTSLMASHSHNNLSNNFTTSTNNTSLFSSNSGTTFAGGGGTGASTSIYGNSLGQSFGLAPSNSTSGLNNSSDSHNMKSNGWLGK